MMRSRFTVGPKGVREDLILPESCRPNQGKELGSCASLWGLTLKFMFNFSVALTRGPSLLFVTSIGQRSSLSICRQYGGGEGERAKPACPTLPESPEDQGLLLPTGHQEWLRS